MRRTVLAAVFALSVSVLFASTSCAQDTSSDNTTLRVLTYNIKRGYGNDRVTDLARTAKVIEASRPDLVALQEVDENCRRSGGVDQASWFGEKLSMHHAFVPFMDYDGGRYGMAVLSRFPITAVDALPLPEGREPRVALVATMKLPGEQTLKMINVHFDYISDDQVRFEQAKKVRDAIVSGSDPAILLGDFNDQPHSRTLGLFEEAFVEAKKPEGNRLTYASDDPKREIDFLFAYPAAGESTGKASSESFAWQIDHVEVIDEPVASDHRPVLSVLRLQAKQ
ncbi:endonuclease/exonuclease/phosphatase family protein [Rhodopirellula sp. JC740]|uniref:Endonuclease/exonuclease/phosphatase family protein n=1 Tax=Rhodopirellula halodulae TaxID=2894198 RepID=A0ABS8NH13_9BACT|nr:endonuclease/exonuclease/phosphatase family protein [Rhodopirellula sp. JC740]MCC9642845.1 endonuclease/exonuclease/phosphatase family protein [Rhodopirellula sp. JC740]